MTSIARIIGVSLQDLSHFVRGERDRIGRDRRKKIRDWMVQRGYLKPYRQRETCICPVCQGKHVKRKNLSSRRDMVTLRAKEHNESQALQTY
jgi:hypothetical protein